MTTATAKPNLVCQECRRENEVERIYCHDCGARLDRAPLAKAKPQEEAPKATRRRLQSMFDGRSLRRRQMFFNGAKLVLGALVIAAVVQMFRAPDLAPEKPKDAAALPAQINMDLDNAAMDPRIGPLHYSDEQVNGYLAYVLKGKRSVLSKYLSFDRLVVGFEEGACRTTVQRSLYGVPIYTSVTFAPEIQNGAIHARVRGGSIGRLPIHPALMQYGDILFADVKTVLERERKSVVKVGNVELHPQAIVVSRKQP